MNTCDHGNCVVVHNERNCPLCQEEGLSRDLGKEIIERDEKIVELEDQIDELLQEIKQGENKNEQQN